MEPSRQAPIGLIQISVQGEATPGVERKLWVIAGPDWHDTLPFLLTLPNAPVPNEVLLLADRTDPRLHLARRLGIRIQLHSDASDFLKGLVSRLSRDTAGPSIEPPDPPERALKNEDAQGWQQLLLAHGLTARETKVAVLAALGATNRAIAEQLFICELTVKRHLTRVFCKLGVKRRSGLRAYLHSCCERTSS